MTKIQILSNTNYQLENVIKSELMEAEQIRIAVAFLQKSGITKVQKALDFSLTQNNSQIEFIVGLDFKTTDYEALMELENLKSKNNQPIELSSIYEYCNSYIVSHELQNKFKSKDFNATIRGELNKHEVNSTHSDNMKLFERINQGVYKLSDIGLRYEKR